MFVMPSQTANGSTLLEVKKGSSVVISTGSNNRMQRSARVLRKCVVTEMV